MLSDGEPGTGGPAPVIIRFLWESAFLCVVRLITRVSLTRWREWDACLVEMRPEGPSLQIAAVSRHLEGEGVEEDADSLAPRLERKKEAEMLSGAT